MNEEKIDLKKITINKINKWLIANQIKKYFPNLNYDEFKFVNEFITSFKGKELNETNITDFYENCDYLGDLYKFNTGRKQSGNKVCKILKYFNVKSVLDFGFGIGFDMFQISKNIDVVYGIDINQQNNIIVKKIIKENDFKNIFIKSSLNEISFVGAVYFIEVIAHLKNPLEFLNQITKKTNIIIFTDDTHVHRESHANDPYHFKHNMKKINNFLIEQGFEKQKFKQPIMPLTYVRKN